MSGYLPVFLSYLFFCFSGGISTAQSINADSLARVYLEADVTEQANILGQLRQTPKQMLILGQKVKKRVQDLGISDTLSNIDYEIAFSHYNNGNYDSAIQILNNAISAARNDANKSSQLAKMLNLAGVAYDFQGQYAEALQSYYESLSIWESLENENGQGIAYINIGNVYAYQKEFYKAIDYYEKSLELSLANRDTVNIVYLYSNIGLIWRKNLDSLELAMDYYQQSLDWAKQHQDEHIRATPLYGITHVQIKRGQLDEALSNAQYILDIAQRQQNTNAKLHAWQLLAHVRWARKERKAAIRAATQAYNLAVASQALMEINTSGKLLADYYFELKDFKKAYDYQAIQMTYQDSVYSIEKSKIISNLERTRDNTRIKMLEKDNALKKAQISEREAVIERQMVYSITASVAVLLLLGGLLLLYRTNKQRNKVSTQLSTQKEQIARSNEQLTQMNNRLRQQQQQLQEQNQDLVRLNSLKNKLLSIISHDFRSPLSSLQGVIAMLNSHALSAEEIEQVFESLSSKVENTTNMLDNLLKWTRNQMHGIRVEPEYITLSTLVEEVVSSQLILAEKKEVTLYCNIASDLSVYADPEMVRLIVRNLVSNAIKFTFKNDSITIGAFQDNNEVTVSVVDTGIGMSSEDINRLFQLKEHTTYGTDNEKGTGLGLILCQEFVEVNGGRIWVESEQGIGSMFHFTLVTHPKQFPNHTLDKQPITTTN
ncbi:ATP-binding protein [Tunicatimonas pelagia]|uniref:ATP-binding protein n=1 Tax=Tunicatimonas pelagia TaxID=931531 RepID=UPI00266528DC|nr:ATP-binding protein [Tunicatimonas pelagia]WKN45838.1 ATP-binding protein [Tunicatimonas pelagia]